MSIRRVGDNIFEVIGCRGRLWDKFTTPLISWSARFISVSGPPGSTKGFVILTCMISELRTATYQPIQGHTSFHDLPVRHAVPLFSPHCEWDPIGSWGRRLEPPSTEE